ncbi:unknown [Bacteroides sp. CAG:633]|nr:unknown [Bacteroides sp. CAG:633]
MTGREDVAAIDATGQDKHLQVVLGQQNPALVLQVDAGIAEHTAHGDQFLIINLQNVAAAERIAQNLFRIETLTQVDVEDAQRIGIVGHGVEKTVDGLARHDAALCQRAEADGTRLTGQSFEGLRVGDVVPSHAFLDVIAGHALGIQLYLDGTRGVRHGFDESVQLFLAEVLQNLCAQFVLAYSTHHAALQPELRHVIGKVGGCSTQFFSFGQHVPQCFAHSDYDWLTIHGCWF